VGERRATLALLLILCLVLPTFYFPLVSAAEDYWITLEPMPTARRLHRVAVIDDELFVIGGCNLTTIFAVNDKYPPIDDIPEFPSGVSLLIMLVAFIVVAMIYRCNIGKHNYGTE
jgi:hypothetical protein